VLEPLDFLRRLAALVSFPYTHQSRRHGIFANRSRFRRLLPPPPRYAEEMGTAASSDVGELEEPSDTGESGSGDLSFTAPRRRVPWAQLLRRVLQVDVLACPRCSTPAQAVPMPVLAFLLTARQGKPALAGGETSVPGDPRSGNFGARAAISPADRGIRARDRS
jgi:hypothetical protein